MMPSTNIARPIGPPDRRDDPRPGSRQAPRARYRISTPVVDETTTEPDERGTPVLLRNVIGDVLREVRQRQGRTLREVSSDAKVSLGYLSEVERGQKEASSELLASISEALNTPLSHIMRVVSGRLAAHEPVRVPDTVPDEFLDELAPAAP
ncbi:helix-turn-helix domain-containing protein [Georgenia sp. Z1344]|uniref:helix-turn-helix domain-containing protein n=1 Tax=Georgenia sp. Z1344 TaxID=3416706 RepID=UPI003CFB8FB8